MSSAWVGGEHAARVPDAPRTLAEDVFAQLRGDIVRGRFQPGAKLGLDALRAAYGVGISPLREALSRLVAEGLVRQESQRGFRVAPASLPDLEDIARNRIRLESDALRLSIANGDDSWGARLVAAHYQFGRSEYRKASGDGADPEEWEVRHRAFHRTLIDACGSRWLLHFCEQLYDQFDRYRRLCDISADTQRHLGTHHTAMMDAALARDADRAAAILGEHIGQTAAAMVDSLGRLAQSGPRTGPQPSPARIAAPVVRKP